MQRFEVLGKLLTLIFAGCLLVAGVGWFKRDQLGEHLQFDPSLHTDPVQRQSNDETFTVHYNDVAYQVDPQFDYKLSGLVVSVREHDGDQLLHRRWNDHLNIVDLCVVWGTNLSADLNKFDFRSGEFTCFYETRDAQAWRRFDSAQISNNHIITDDDWLREQFADLRTGDQFSLRGKLAGYSHSKGFSRGTSTVRTDTGNGACETIYAESLTVLSRANQGWRWAFAFSWWGAAGSALLWVIGVMYGRI